MKVLFYNWTPLNVNGKGGGVAVYLKNVLHFLKERKCDIEPSVLTSGYYYDDFQKVYLREEEQFEGADVYSIINSPILAPSVNSVSCLKELLNDSDTVNIFDEFIRKKGPFDVIHFESLEGISPNVLALKKKYPRTKFIHSVHDYGVVCPSVRLWTNEGMNCYLQYKCRNCCKCMNFFMGLNFHDTASLRPAESNDVEKSFVKGGVLKRALRLAKRKILLHSKSHQRLFDEWNRRNVELINQFVDVEICVSNRVAEIIEQMGVKKNKIVVDYIGTKAAEKSMLCSRTDVNSSDFTLLYMGYAKVEKGFYFLLDALESLADCSNVVLKFASKIQNKSDLDRLNRLKSKFKDVVIYDGYSHADFPKIMDGVNLGVVPPLWEDNLPQVTIEMIANGIPVLTSSNGGAHELNSHADFTFKDKDDFIGKLTRIMENRNLLRDYWECSKKLTTMEEHMESLLKEYKND